MTTAHICSRVVFRHFLQARSQTYCRCAAPTRRTFASVARHNIPRSQSPQTFGQVFQPFSSHSSRFFASSRSRSDTAASSPVASPEAPDYLSEGELKVFKKLLEKLEPSKLEVQDISGGCGSMYGLDIVSSRFAGLSVIKQHKLVNEVLKDEIATWHGVQLKTKAA